MGLAIEELEPDPALSGAVLRAADFHERAPGGLRRLEGPMLGAVVIISLGPDIEVAGERIGSFAAGLWDRPVVTGHFGEQVGYQLNLDLLSAGRLLGVPMSELANRLVRLEDLLGPLVTELVERMASAPDAASRHALAQGLLVRRLAEPSRCSPTVKWALSRIRASRGAERVEAIAAGIGCSRRHLATSFREQVGLSPKAVARLVRCEHAVSLVRAGKSLSEVAYEAGYSDQPHFNRDFRDLVGCAPTDFPFVQDGPATA